MSEKSSTFLERLCLFLLIASFLLGLGLVQFRREQPSFTLQVLSERPSVSVPSPMISLNSATEEELERLPGVGPRLAERIVDARNRQGPFTRVDQLLSVKGMGQKLYKRIFSYLKIE